MDAWKKRPWTVYQTRKTGLKKLATRTALTVYRLTICGFVPNKLFQVLWKPEKQLISIYEGNGERHTRQCSIIIWAQFHMDAQYSQMHWAYCGNSPPWATNPEPTCPMTVLLALLKIAKFRFELEVHYRGKSLIHSSVWFSLAERQRLTEIVGTKNGPCCKRSSS